MKHPGAGPGAERGSERLRLRLMVSGLVQGVGFRPHVYATAARLGLSGWVRNDGGGVVIEVEGARAEVAGFEAALRSGAPPLARIDDVGIVAQSPCGGTGFRIEDSSASGGSRALVSPDVSVCRECLAELSDPEDRRYRYPFITCTNCGPRFTIVTGLPYDRPRTTMAGFPLCQPCRHEYEDPADRRFHAQPIACPDCGPTVRLEGEAATRWGESALGRARALVAGGKILAVKGLGGYHLVCDASNERVVAELRRRKQRGGKPFAVMVADLVNARTLVQLDDVAERLLAGDRKPVVLAPRARNPTAPVAASVAPDNPDLGVMLPYTPLHVLLLGLASDPSGPQVLVMTSGNLSGEPIVTDDRAARERLAGLVDAWLMHDRPIQVPCDDSVVRCFDGLELPVRRSRGYAPLPIALPFAVEPALAVGADLKNTCAVAAGRYAWMSQHIGDVEDLSTLDALGAAAQHLATMTGVEPGTLVADAHPGYRSAAWARAHAEGRPVRTVQHHHAHIASVMGEHGVAPGTPVIGVAFDGTGYGTDGAVWGGEVLLADYDGFQRMAHLGYVPLAGGDVSVERPYRMALAHLWATRLPWDDDLPPVAACPPREREVLAHQLETGLGCVPTSSMGRLFDAIASLAGVRHVAAYEAEAAIALEGLTRTQSSPGGSASCESRGTTEYRFVIRGAEVAGDPETIDAGEVVRSVIRDVRGGAPTEMISDRFHAAVVQLVVDLAQRCRAEHGVEVVVLGGGVFQNTRLLSGCLRGLRGQGFHTLHPQQLPPNDGGLALGQILVGAPR